MLCASAGAKRIPRRIKPWTWSANGGPRRFHMLKLQRRCDLPLTAIFIGTCCAAAAGQGTTFTYQGQLKDSGTAVSGAYNMTFRLFDADVAGNQVGLDVALPATAVTSGLFTVPLDFGAVFS